MDKLAQVYSFKMEVIDKIFKNLMKKLDFVFPISIMLNDVGKHSNPNYFHTTIGLVIL